MNKRWLQSILTVWIVVSFVGSGVNSAQAQDNNSDEVEVYLDFRHRGVVNTVVVTYYKADQFYLPVTELFSYFNIDASTEGLITKGKFGVEQIPYEINLQNQFIRFGEKRIDITADEYLVKELDNYLRADIFEDAFDLNFSVDFNNLVLSLETERELPAVQEALRKQRRQIADRNRLGDEKYELRYDRERPFLDGGFVDYNLSANLTNEQQVYNFNTNIGMQVYGGDLQGAIFGSYSDNFTNFSTDNLRWRYMLRDQNWLSKITVGQTSSDGILKNSYTGVRLSNEPIEPRRLFDEFVVQGSTIPESEVELYLNNSLVDFQEADELGNYRFLTPVTYGSSQLDLKIYGPTGQIIERSNRIQIPFTFQPQGVFNYNLNFGRLDNPLFGQTTQNYITQGSGAFGVTDWLTSRAGVEYLEGYNTDLPTFSSALSARILSNHIITVEGVSDEYYRGVINAIYPNSASLNVDYTEFTGGFSPYNSSNDNRRIRASVFYPFNFWGLPFNLRASAFSRIRSASNSSTTLRLDANSRIGKMNLRVAYSDRVADDFDFVNPSNLSYLESSATYNFSRGRNVPNFLKGLFLRAQMRYFPVLDQFESAEFLVARSLFQNGRFQVSYGRNFQNNFNSLRFSIVIDFDKVRTNSTFNNIRGTNNYTQNIRGSIGYDTNYNNFLFTSRDMVGRSATAIKLFVDNNNNGTFEEDEDDPIRGNAVRVLRSGATSMQKNGILYYTQMQPYYYYNMEMNKGAIQNPMLVPEIEQFGLITDPNRFKKVEIPFYMSGVIDGYVERLRSDSSKKGIGGLKLTLSDSNGDYAKELRTFSDGSFYEWEVPPGSYELEVDAGNLRQLNSKSIPEKLSFDVEAVPEGDFVEGLSFLLVPSDFEVPEDEVEPIVAGSIPDEIKTDEQMLALEAELNENVDDVLRLIIQAQRAFYNKNVKMAMELVDESLDIFETAQGYALKGSLCYLKNEKENARTYWDLAKKFDPDIYIPDMEQLDQMVISQSESTP